MREQKGRLKKGGKEGWKEKGKRKKRGMDLNTHLERSYHNHHSDHTLINQDKSWGCVNMLIPIKLAS